MQHMRPRLLLCEKCSSYTTPNHSEKLVSLSSHDESAHLRSTLKEREARLKCYDDRIARALQHLKTLEIGRSSIQDDIIRCRSALSIQLLQRVPTEIWELIFTHVCDYPNEYSFVVDFDLDQNPHRTIRIPTFILSRVCSRWRDIVKGCPKLWSSFRVGLAELPFDIGIPLRVSLENSKDRPLRLFISAEASHPPTSFKFSEQGKAAWEMLTSSLHRCKELIFNIPDSYAFPSFPSDLYFPYLDTYHEASYCSGFVEDWSPSLAEAIQFRAPVLRNAALWTLHPTFPYSQLTSLTTWVVNDSEIDSFIAILRTCQKLETLTIRGLDAPNIDLDGMNKQSDVVLPSLQQLSILDDHGEYDPNNSVLLTLLSCFSMPSLVYFEMNARDWPASGLLVTMLRRSPMLERLSLDFNNALTTGSLDVSQYPLLPLLDALTSLRHLDFASSFSTSECPGPLDSCRLLREHFVDAVVTRLLSRLQPEAGRSGSSFLPHLESLHLRFSEITTDTISKVREKVQVATSSRHCLRDVRLALYDENPDRLDLS